MSDDRLARALHAYWSETPGRVRSSMTTSALRFGLEWADAHPYSTPEALVAAYEEGQRDAVEKGLARARVTSAQLHHVAWMLQNLPEDKIAAMLPGLLGIEVRDE